MNLALVIGVVVAAGFAALGAAKVLKTTSMRARAEHVGFTAESYQLIGIAELVGAAGVIAGLVYTPAGYAAGIGLLVLVAGAVGVHLKSGASKSELTPAAVFAGATLAYLIALGVSR
jgi:hypothetical protein